MYYLPDNVKKLLAEKLDDGNSPEVQFLRSNDGQGLLKYCNEKYGSFLSDYKFKNWFYYILELLQIKNPFDLFTELHITEIPARFFRSTDFEFDSIVVVPDSIAEIGYNAFGVNKSIKTLIFGNSIKSQQLSAAICAYCSNLKDVKLPNNIVKIQEAAFLETKLEEIRIPASVLSVESEAFKDCHKLKKIIFEGPRTAPIELDIYSLIGCNQLRTYVVDNIEYPIDFTLTQTERVFAIMSKVNQSLNSNE